MQKKPAAKPAAAKAAKPAKAPVAKPAKAAPVAKPAAKASHAEKAPVAKAPAKPAVPASAKPASAAHQPILQGPAAVKAVSTVDLSKLRDLLRKHKVVLPLLKESHYLSKQSLEVRQAFEAVVTHYTAEKLHAADIVQSNNRRDHAVREILRDLMALK